MAAVEAALVAVATADAGIAALIGNRIFPAGGRQGAAYPYASYSRVSTQGTAHLDGASNLDWPRLQIDFWADTPAAAIALAEAFRTAFDGVDHNAANPPFHATLQDQRGPAADEETRKFRVSQDYYFWHERT